MAYFGENQTELAQFIQSSGATPTGEETQADYDVIVSQFMNKRNPDTGMYYTNAEVAAKTGLSENQVHVYVAIAQSANLNYVEQNAAPAPVDVLLDSYQSPVPPQISQEPSTPVPLEQTDTNDVPTDLIWVDPETGSKLNPAVARDYLGGRITLEEAIQLTASGESVSSYLSRKGGFMGLSANQLLIGGAILGLIFLFRK